MKKQYTIKELVQHAITCGTSVQAVAISELGEQYNTSIWLEYLGEQYHNGTGINLMTFAYEDISTERCEMITKELLDKYRGIQFTLEQEN